MSETQVAVYCQNCRRPFPRDRRADWETFGTGDDGAPLLQRFNLLTPADLELIPDGAALISINGATYIKGKDKIDGDIRFGHLAYGCLNCCATSDSREGQTPVQELGLHAKENVE